MRNDIDQEDFFEKLQALADRLGIELKKSVLKHYYPILNQQLSPELFERAWASLYASYQGYGLPTPQQFVEAAVGTVQDRVMGEWAAICELADSRTPCTITETARQALAQVGGTMALRTASPKDRGFLARDFERIYSAKVASGEFDPTPREMGRYLPADHPDRRALPETPLLGPAITAEQHAELRQRLEGIGGPKPAQPPARVQPVGSSPRERFANFASSFDLSQLHDDPILRREQVAQLAWQLQQVAEQDPGLLPEVESFISGLTPVSTAA